jgi:hypothetical protein
MSQNGAYEVNLYHFHEVLALLGKEKNPDVSRLKSMRSWELRDFRITQASWNFLNKSIIAASSDGELAMLDVDTGIGAAEPKAA